MFSLAVQHLWEEASKLKDRIEDMEKELAEGKMEIERTTDDYIKLKVCLAVFICLFVVVMCSFHFYSLLIFCLQI